MTDRPAGERPPGEPYLEAAGLVPPDGQSWTPVGLVAASGERVGILCAEGGGLEPLLLVLAGLVRPRSGSVRVRGVPIPLRSHAAERDRRVRMGIAMRHPMLIHNVTLFDNIALPLRYHRRLDERVVRERVSGILGALGIEGLAHHRPAAVDAGAKRLAALGRALVVDPDFLLLESPHADLGNAERARARRCIEGNLSERATVVVGAHEVAEISGLVSSFHVMRDRAVEPSSREASALTDLERKE